MDRGGAPDIVRLLFEKLPPDEFDLTLIYGRTVCPSERTKALLRELGQRAVLIPSLRRDVNAFYDLKAFFNIFIILRKSKFDIVHTHTAKAGALGRVAAKMAGVRNVVYSLHGHDFYGYFGYWGSRAVVWAEKIASLFCDKIHALTELEKKDLILFNICPEYKIEVIYSGVDLDLLRPSQQILDNFKQGPSKDKTYQVGMVGRLEPVKGPRYFIDAAEIVLKQKSNVKFMVVGDGVLKDALQKRVMDSGLAEKIIFTGWREDVNSILFTLDILVLPSLNEAVGRSALEAQGLGVPVVAANVGGLPEVVKDGVTGFLVEPKDPAALAGALIKLLNDDNKRREMGQAARGWVDEKFSDRVMVEKFEGLYKKLINREQKSEDRRQKTEDRS
ncbi:MAG: glycosyltransferase family 4 protein [Candidatus Omnitrophica bacterium]|nr:glycosyltransferase family 4 protein [Candidatus Omnitrophota bacterium]